MALGPIMILTDEETALMEYLEREIDKKIKEKYAGTKNFSLFIEESREISDRVFFKLQEIYTHAGWGVLSFEPVQRKLTLIC